MTIMEQIERFFVENPYCFGICLAIMGIGGLIIAIRDADWLFNMVSGVMYNRHKTDDQVIMYGQKTIRVVLGIISAISILGGIIWFWTYAFHYK